MHKFTSIAYPSKAYQNFYSLFQTDLCAFWFSIRCNKISVLRKSDNIRNNRFSFI